MVEKQAAIVVTSCNCRQSAPRPNARPATSQGSQSTSIASKAKLTLDVVTQDLAVALGTALAESLASLATSRHGCCVCEREGDEDPRFWLATVVFCCKVFLWLEGLRW